MRETKGQVRRRATLTAFVDHWMVNGRNATKAIQAMAERKGKTVLASTASVRGARYLAAAEQAGLVQARIERVTGAMGVDELIRRESECARADVTRFVTLAAPVTDGAVCATGPNPPPLASDWTYDLRAIIAAGQGHLIKRLTQDRDTGRTHIELYDAQEARKTLGAWYGLGRDTQAMTGPSSGVTVNVLAALPESAVAALYAALVGAGPAIELAAVPVGGQPDGGAPTPPPTGGQSAGGETGGSFGGLSTPGIQAKPVMPLALRDLTDMGASPGVRGSRGSDRGADVGGGER